jgi:hypothetical protein
MTGEKAVKYEQQEKANTSRWFRRVVATSRRREARERGTYVLGRDWNRL